MYIRKSIKLFFPRHAVISIGHSHPHYVEMIQKQVAELGFYSNSVVNKLQQQLAERLGRISGYEDYSFFMINSGAEANENALKLASFHTGRKRVVSFSKSFHVKKVTAPYKYPRVIEFVDELPKTISGKIRRVEIRDKDSKK